MNAKADYSAKALMASVPEKLKFRWRSNRTAFAAVATVFGGLLITGILLATAPGQEALPPEEKAWPVSALVVQLSDASPMAPLFGRVESPREAKIASRLAAEVTAVNAREGDDVKKGQVLLQLDDADLRLVVAQSEANFAEANAQLESIRMRAQTDARLLEHQRALSQLTDKKVTRQKSLLVDKMIAQAVVDDILLESQQQAIRLEQQKWLVVDAGNTEKLAEAKVARAEAELARARLQLSYATVTAPFDGVVSRIFISEGDRLQIGSPTLQMFDRNSLQVRTSIPSDYVGAIKSAIDEGKPVLAVAESYQHPVELKLINLTSSVAASGASVDGLFQVGESGDWLVLGQMLSLSLLLPKESAVVRVPPQALYDQGRVYVITDGRLVPIEVDVLGETHDRGPLELLLRSSQLHDGTVLLSSRLGNAKSGLRVDPAGRISGAPALVVQKYEE